MLEHSNWTIGLGHFGKIHVRLHIFFLLFAALGFLLTDQLVPRQDADGMLGNTLLLFGLLFVSVLLHEFGHVQAAMRLKGHVERVVIGPLGGLEAPFVHPTPKNILLLSIAGPLVNVGLCGVAAVVLWWMGRFEPFGLLNLFQPHDITVGMTSERILRVTFWVNAILFLVNMLPAFPFDGKRIFIAALALLWREKDFQRSVAFVSVLGKGCAVVLLFLAWFMQGDSLFFPDFPAWFGFVILGLFLFFSSERGAPQPEEEIVESSVFDWLERHQADLADQDRREEEEEKKMEEILIRLHRDGHGSLNKEDMEILQRVSARYRQRLDGAKG